MFEAIKKKFSAFSNNPDWKYGSTILNCDNCTYCWIVEHTSKQYRNFNENNCHLNYIFNFQYKAKNVSVTPIL